MQYWGMTLRLVLPGVFAANLFQDSTGVMIDYTHRFWVLFPLLPRQLAADREACGVRAECIIPAKYRLTSKDTGKCSGLLMTSKIFAVVGDGHQALGYRRTRGDHFLKPYLKGVHPPTSS